MIVVSDLEGTLTTGGTVRGIVKYLRKYRNSVRFMISLYSQLAFYTVSRVGRGAEQNARVRLLKWVLNELKGLDQAQFGDVVNWLLDNELWPKRREDVIAELEAHHKAGHRVVIVSGTFAPIAEAFASCIGVEAIGSPMEIDGSGRLTGKLTGSVSVRGEKVERIRQLANGDTIGAAYGDTEA